MTVLKRSRQEEAVEALAMANCLMLLSRVGGAASASHRVFTCKTCNREFPSFQALGGHRASHKKLRPPADGEFLHVSPAKLKTHECSICGLEFPVGQALGGHMRRHRGGAIVREGTEAAEGTAVEDRNGRKEVWGLDLNLTPYENDVMFKMIPSWLIA
ncbi:LOW QUALITY PROTEIN: zinc finger protein ZAT7-like [Actinidia eriantha]|uniref:LOW QUALITY PROTEIN: zinc finger protein ZAT7-like n=1 Tax=Actinidia eriantha TaxID=165200 RepID=UPI002583A936|nr:LOW QUALITY PROTEIN: zinc finger protein ZAT7-like [Actinidia eriantha]